MDKKKLVKKLIKYLRENLIIGESYARGDVYLKIINEFEMNDPETLGGDDNLDFDNEFWKKVEEIFNKVIE